MKVHQSYPRDRAVRPANGFALITVLIISSLIVLLVLALLSLSANNQRLSAASQGKEEARANAVLSLQLAIGELQLRAGPDMRVTAPAPTLKPATSDADARNPDGLGLIGAWRSWENSDFTDTTKPPTAPDYSQKTVKGSAGDPSSRGRFLGWLASKKTTTTDSATTPPLVTERTGSIPMLGKGTLGDPTSGGQPVGAQVHLEPLPVDGGSVAWWIGGENTKALLSFPDIDRTKLTAPEQHIAYRASMATHSIPDPKALGLNLAVQLTQVATRLVSRESIDLAATATRPTGEKFHHITTHSRGLLTNTNRGGWRRDISLLAESLSQDPPIVPDGWPPFATKDDQSPQDAWIYPWATMRFKGENRAMWQQVGPVMSWRALADYVKQYREMSASGTFGEVAFNPATGDISNSTYSAGFLHSVNRMPIVADIRFMIAYSAIAPPVGATDGKYTPCITVNPVVTLWNPWNYRVQIQNFDIRLANLPMIFTMTVGGKTFDLPYYLLTGTVQRAPNDWGQMTLTFPTSPTLGSGETVVFSPTSATLIEEGSGTSMASLPMAPGYRTEAGCRYKIYEPTPLLCPTGEEPQTRAGAPLALAATDTMAVTKVRVSASTFHQHDQNQYLSGIYTNWHAKVELQGSTGSTSLTDLWVSAHRQQFLPAVAKTYYPDLAVKNPGGVNMQQVAGDGSKNHLFSSASIAYRSVNDTNFPSRGMHQMNPNTLYTELGIKGGIDISQPGGGIYKGAMHPVNGPYELSFQSHAGWNETTVPNVVAGSFRGFTLTGFYKDKGISRCILSEIPVKPLLSLGELQNFQARGQNPFPPFRNHIFGNSVAYPIFPPDAVQLAPQPNQAGITPYVMQYDDSYCMNRIFWDDFFLSTISPTLTPGKWDKNIARPQKIVYRDHLRQIARDQSIRAQAKPLPNTHYLPVPLPSNMTEDAAVDRDLNLKTGWATIASRLLVEGMFNVNSTSVDAWKSVLSQARDMPVTTLEAARANNARVGLEKSQGMAFARNTVSGEANSSNLTGYAKLIGFRRLTDDQIDALALEIVKQIRKRGPALSLAEFVNRQLRPSGDPNVDLALAGPVQAALDELAKLNDGRNPFKELQENYCIKVDATKIPSADPNAAYVFPKAAEGWTGEGLPGWTTQADILRPLASALTPRDDTFIIRTFGESKNKAGKVMARVWCEAIVQREGDYIVPDPSMNPPDDANLTTGANKELNSRFGRRFKILSIRYLAPTEV